MFLEPLTGRRWVDISENRTKTPIRPPRCTRPSIRRKPDASRRSWRSTARSKHGSWLNMVEIELSVLSRQCLERRVCRTSRRSKRSQWPGRSDTADVKIDWRFGTEDERIKLKRLYSSLQE